MPKTYDAIIIGAGIMGCSISLELARQGYKTLVVDKLPAAGYGSTSNSCAVIRLNYSTLEGSALAFEGYHCWDNWLDHLGVEDERGMARFNKTGCLIIKTEANGFLETTKDFFDQLNIEYDDMDLDRLAEFLPDSNLKKFQPARPLDDPNFGQASEEPVDGALFTPQSGFISDPQLASHNFQAAALKFGGEFLFNAEVKVIRQEKGAVTGVTLIGGEEMNAPIIINAAGPHSFIINQLAGVYDGMKIKTRALRREVAHLPLPNAHGFEKLSYVTQDADIGCYTRPEVGGNVLVGSLDPECDKEEWVDPDEFNKNFTDQWKVQVYRQAQRFPGLPIPNKWQGVVDLYDVSDDWIPIYDKSDLAGFYMAVGTSGNQFKNAPVVGRLMAELISKCEKGRDHDSDPVQYHMPHTGRSLNLGFFSRLRDINPDSSFTVVG